MTSFVLFLIFLGVFSFSAEAAIDDDTPRHFNITKILNNYTDYDSFNSLLSQYKVADIINHRKTITVLAVTDVSAITSHPDDVAKKILMNHVILDFYGLPKLKKLKKSSILTTLLQTTGSARSRQGFINVTVSSDGDVVMGSAVKGAEHNSKVLDEVMKRPFDICVLAISQPIIAPGVDKMVLKEDAPSPSPRARSPRKAKSPKSEEGPSSEDEDPPSPPSSEAPADEPTAADEPAADKKDADAPSPESSVAAGRVGLSIVAALMGFMCFWAVV